MDPFVRFFDNFDDLLSIVYKKNECRTTLCMVYSIMNCFDYYLWLKLAVCLSKYNRANLNLIYAFE